MASSEQQPLKKRRLYEPSPKQHEEEGEEETQPPPPQEPPPPPPPPQTLADEPETPVAPPPTPPPLSQDEILARRRNRDEIKMVYDAYKRLKSCISRKQASSPDLEQAFLSLITASRGCASVQRIVSDLVPRYAAYCPTAIEAAVKVVINMHNLNIEVVNRGEDLDGIAFETAKSCIFGLADICWAAASSSEAAPRLSVIRGICAVVFQTVLSFFVSLFEGKDVISIVDQGILEMGDSLERFCELKRTVTEEDGSPLVKLSKCRVLSFVWILFSCPKNLLTACFELFRATSMEGIREGEHFMHQVTSRFNADGDGVTCDALSEDVEGQNAGPANKHRGEEMLSDGNSASANASSGPRSCLLQVVLGNNMSLRSWLFSKYKKLCDMPAFVAAAETKSALEDSLEPFKELVEVEDSRIDSDEDDGSASTLINQQYSMSRISNENSGEIPGSSHDSGGSRSMDFESVDPRDVSRSRSSIPRDLPNQQMHSPIARTTLDFSSNSLDSRSYNVNIDTGPASNAFASPRHQILWFYDGDFGAMDVFAASRQLWLGCFGSDVSESQIRFQLERFGYIQQFFFFPLKGFAVVEYRSLMDAVRCREHLRSHFHWQVKFMDIGLGTRGTTNGVAVGSSTCLYVGSILSQWARDEIIHESRKVLYKGPSTVTDLGNEGALLMDFETPEEATAVMAHLRQYRRERSNYLPPSNVGSANVAMHHADVRSSNPGNMCNNMMESPHAQTLTDSADSSRTRMSHLSSLVASLRAKCNLPQNPEYFDNHVSGSRWEEGGPPSNMLWICHSNFSSPYPTDDDIMAICNIAVANIGSIVNLTRTSMQTGCGWFVECSNIDAAATILKNLCASPGMFLHMEFSQPSKVHGSIFSSKSESGSMELVSPRVTSENHGMNAQAGHPFGMVDPMHGGGHVASLNADQTWMYKKNEIELHPAPGSIPCMPTGSQGPSIPPPQQFHPPSFAPPVYLPPNSSWDPQGSNQHYSMNPISPAAIPNSFHGSTVTPPFVPASGNPVAQVPRPPMQHCDQMFSLPFMSQSIPSMPLQPELAPPLPPSPPPAPPPPSSPPPPPPPPASDSSQPESSGLSEQYLWQGSLSKSGVHYCTIYARRLNSDVCKYSNDISEPAEWPIKLDMTKRTDFQHVKSTFTSTPPNRREVCQLVPSAVSDQKGFQDFITYLKQRECAGVIKIPAARSIWSRLLFILTHSDEICSILGVAPDVSSCLIALVLPKETNFEWA